MNAAKRLRQMLGLNQQQMADLLGIRQSTVSRWEGETNLSGDAMRALNSLGKQRLGRRWRSEWLFPSDAQPSDHANTTSTPDDANSPGGEAPAG